MTTNICSYEHFLFVDGYILSAIKTFFLIHSRNNELSDNERDRRLCGGVERQGGSRRWFVLICVDAVFSKGLRTYTRAAGRQGGSAAAAKKPCVERPKPSRVENVSPPGPQVETPMQTDTGSCVPCQLINFYLQELKLCFFSTFPHHFILNKKY